jgi:hypothetical protein
MLKHHPRSDLHTRNVRHPENHELPKLPDDVVIPDDLSQLAPQRRNRLVRWGWWVAALAVIAGGAVVAISQWSDDTPAEVDAPAIDAPAYDLKQQAIDDGMARLEERVPDVRAYVVDLEQDRLANEALALDVPPYDLKQQAIDDGMARLEERVPDVRAYIVELNVDRLADQDS